MKSGHLHGKRICIVCSEPGAAQVVLLLYEHLKRHGSKVLIVAKGAGKNIARRLMIPIEKERIAYKNIRTIRSYLVRKMPDVIITGTSLEDDLERNYIKVGKSLGIRSIAVIDWWMHYKERFVRSKTDELCIPDWVCVNDERAKRAARFVLGGKVKIVVTGNPYFADALAHHKRSPHDKRKMMRSLRLDPKLPTILFIAEPLYPPYINQFEIFEHIAKEMRRAVTNIRSQQYNLIIKFHPSEQGSRMHEKYGSIIQRHLRDLCKMQLVNAYDIHTLIESADYVWGMNSAPLLEAMVRGKLTSSFLPNVPYLGIPFQRHAGFCPSVDSYAQFSDLIKSLLTDKQFVKKAMMQQKKYKLPKENFIEKVFSLL